MRRLDPAARRTAVAWLVVVIGLFLAAAWLSSLGMSSALDQAVRSVVREDTALPLSRPMRMLSRLASGYVLLAVALVCSVVLWRRRHHAIALALPLIGLTAVVSLAVTKWVINKPRPSLRDYGFPSGHVFGVTVFVMLTGYLLWRFDAPRGWQRAARAGGIVFVVLVAYSRLYVNAHWLSDVVGGVLVGVAFAVGAMLVVDRQPRTPP